jgi:DNA-binding NarL/FixJ family response regulator
VGQAGNQRQALEKFPGYRPQLTVMDFLMPEIKGSEAARQLTERNPDALILMVTTDPPSQLEEEAKWAGIKGLCAKDEMQSRASAIDTVINGGTYSATMSRASQRPCARRPHQPGRIYLVEDL